MIHNVLNKSNVNPIQHVPFFICLVSKPVSFSRTQVSNFDPLSLSLLFFSLQIYYRFYHYITSSTKPSLTSNNLSLNKQNKTKQTSDLFSHAAATQQKTHETPSYVTNKWGVRNIFLISLAPSASAPPVLEKDS